VILRVLEVTSSGKQQTDYQIEVGDKGALSITPYWSGMTIQPITDENLLVIQPVRKKRVRWDEEGDE
jgi:hypothetical protein